jgi:hypothetical protein
MKKGGIVKKILLEKEKKKSKIHTKKWERCFDKVSKEKGDESAAAICTSSIGYKGSIYSKHRRKDETIEEGRFDNFLDKVKSVFVPKCKECGEYEEDVGSYGLEPEPAYVCTNEECPESDWYYGRHLKENYINVNPKMKKGELVEYINSKRNLTEQRGGNGPHIIPEMDRPSVAAVIRFLEKLRESGVINMFGSSPILNWDRNDLDRWLYGQSKDPESYERQIEELKDENEDGENDSDIDMLEEQLSTINYLLDNKQKVRDALVRASLKRIENTNGNNELHNVQRVFERMANEAFQMWTTTIYGN